MTDQLGQPLTDFIAQYISSVEELEVLLLLREGEGSALSVTDINDRIRSDVDSIRARLSSLSDSQLVRSLPGASPGDQRFEYAPQRRELRQLVDLLAAAYRDRRPRVIKLIYSKPLKDLSVFTQAFVWRRKGGADNG